jgi:glucose/arabinose dehydrogenase
LAVLGAVVSLSCTATAKPPPGLAAPPAAVASKVTLTKIADAVQPVGLTYAPGDPLKRLFIVERGGKVRVFRDGQLAAAPFLDVGQRIALRHSEQGLLGLAFHPQHATNGLFYVNFTDVEDDTRVLELKTAPGGAVDPSHERQLLHVAQPYRNHNGGHLAFGPDGKLYVGLGDGGSAGDPQGHAQNPQSQLGKMLRIDVNTPQVQVETIQRGLRNPWRYSFDRKTGDLYIADVGQNKYEWVHVAKAGNLTGLNFGWNVVEGSHCYSSSTCDKTPYPAPLVEYTHDEGCSISGGFVYRGKALPDLDGHYFYADFCSAIVRSARWADGRVQAQWEWRPTLDPDSRLSQLAAFGEDEAGELYLISHDGPIYRFDVKG